MTKRNNRIEEPFRKNVSFMLLIYWTILVIWQNISKVQAKSSSDILIKSGLLIYFSLFYLRRARHISVKIIWPFIMSACVLITSLQETDFSVGLLLKYCYPVIFVTMVYAIGDKYEINRKQLISFYNGIILITMYCAVYAILFCTDQFANAFSITNAYGNELTSFFISPHEYGMYLAAGSISCLVCLRLDLTASVRKRVLYYVSLFILLLNLVLTFSRTTIFSVVIFLLIYIFFENRSTRRKMLILLVIALFVVLLTPMLRSFVFNIVMKGNDLGVREEIYTGVIDIYLESDDFEKIWGYGVNKTDIIIRTYFNKSSAHNAYLQILLNFGAVGLTFLLGFLASQILASLKLLRISRYFGGLSLGLCIMASAMMFTNTAIIFSSPIDSFFLTIFAFVVPKYVRNAIKNNRFD